MADEEQGDSPETEDQELSLDRLSEAYAQVLRQQADQGTDGGNVERGQLVAEKIARETAADRDKDTSDAEVDPEIFDEAADDDSACPMVPKSIVESILFVGAPKGEKLTSKKIASVMRDVSAKEVTAIAKELDQQYQKENAAFRVRFDAGAIEMVLAEDLGELQNEFFGRNRAATLSQSAIDILAVVAYRQPIGRDEIEKARNKPVGGVLKQLVNRNLLITIPDKDNAAKKLYKTTDRFLDLFQLSELEDLPQAHDFSDLGDLD